MTAEATRVSEPRDYELIVEVTIRPGDAYAGDLVDERWLQLSLDRQPSPLAPMHEQFLALFARAGYELLPARPTIRYRPSTRCPA